MRVPVRHRPTRVLVVLLALLGGIPALAPPARAAVPTISSFSPVSGPVGTGVVIKGTGFIDTTLVKFNGVSAGFTVNSGTKITATVPGLATTGPITVTNPSGTATSASNFTVTFGMSLSKTVGHPAITTNVSGSGFGAYEFVDIYFDTTDVALATTDATGNFAGFAIQVPASAVPGTHWISAGGRRTGMAAQRTFTVRTDWPQFRFSNKRRGKNSYENVVNPSNVAGLDQDWAAATGAPIALSSPAVVDGVAYVGSDDGKLYAFDATVGTLKWASTATGTPIWSSPTVANGVVYVGSYDGKLYAFPASCFDPCSPLWAGTTGGSISSSPAVANGVVYAGSQDGKLYAYDLAAGLTAASRPDPASLRPDRNLRPRSQ